MTTEAETNVIHILGEIEFDRDKLKQTYLKQISDSKSKTVLLLAAMTPILILGLVDMDNEEAKTKTKLLTQNITMIGERLCKMEISSKESVLDYYLDSSRNALLSLLEIMPLLKKHSKAFVIDCPDPLYSRVVETTENLLYSGALLDISYEAVFGCPGCPSCQPDTETPTSETSTQKTPTESGRVLH